MERIGKRGQSRTAIYRRNRKKLRQFFKVFPPSGQIPLPQNFLEPQPSTNTQPTVHPTSSEDNDNYDDNDDFDDGDVNDSGDSDNDNSGDSDNDNSGDSDNDNSGDSDNDNSGDSDNDNSVHSDNDNVHDNYSYNQPFFDGSKIAGSNIPLIPKYHIDAKEHLLAIVAMSIRHHQSYEATLNALRWTKISHTSNCLPTTKPALWKALSRDDSCVTHHFYCKKCETYFDKKNVVTEELEKECVCGACGPNKSNACLGCFQYISLFSQIRQLLRIPSIAESLRYRFRREKIGLQTIEDIYDGEEYRLLCSPGNILEPWYNFSLCFNTDGCQVSNSSHTSAWPIYATINELPPHMRKKHMLLAAIYVDCKHPLMTNFLRPFVEEIQQLYEIGITWNPSETTEVTSKFIVTSTCLDSPARAAVTCMTQFNGYNACSYCYAPGYFLRRGKFVYPVQQSFRLLRTSTELIADMQCAFDTGKIVNGVKGFSPLAAMPGFNICKGVIVDSMHTVYLGVAKQHTKLLLLTKKAPYYVGSPDNINKINNCLLKIKPPSRRSRKPRSIDTFGQWKATEWRNWLDYAPICLRNVLEPKYVNHLALLSEAVHIINGDAISLVQLDRAENLLKKYVKDFEKFFGLESMISNIHLLTHITDSIRNWGPIWASSTFIFEAWNKKIMECLTSSQKRGYQIVTRFLMEKFITSTVNDPSLSSETKNFISKTLRIQNEIENGEKKNKFIELSPLMTRPATQEENLALLLKNYRPSHLYCAKKSLLNGTQYRCHQEKNIKFCNSIIYDGIGMFGTIETIAKFKHNNSIVGGVFIRKYRHLGYSFNTQYIHKVSPSNELVFIEESAILKPGFIISLAENVYAMKLPNCWEFD